MSANVGLAENLIIVGIFCDCPKQTDASSESQYYVVFSYILTKVPSRMITLVVVMLEKTKIYFSVYEERIELGHIKEHAQAYKYSS